MARPPIKVVEAYVNIERIQRRVRDRIVALRKEMGLTQESFDQEPNKLSYRSLQRYEQAKNPNIELRSLLKIAAKLGVHPRELLKVKVD